MDFRQGDVKSSVFPLSAKGHYPVIFGNAGQLALSNAFIHVLIPLNLTKIRRDLETIQKLLTNAVETDHQLFTKNSYYDRLISISSDNGQDSSTFMTRFVAIKNQFDEICNLLPDSKGFHLDENLFLTHPDLLPLAQLRKKRNLAMLLPFFKEAVGTFWGMFGKPALSSIMSKVASGSKPENVLLSLSQDQMKKASQAVKRVATSIFKTQSTMTSNREYFRMYPIYAEAVNVMERHVTKVINVIQQLHNHRLAIDWLQEKEMHAIHQSIQKFARANDISPLTTTWSDYFQLETSYVRDGFDVTAILHVPCAGGNELLSLLKFVPAPIPLPAHNRFFNSIESSLTLSSPHPVTETFPEALFVKPEADYIAIGSSTSYKLLSTQDLSSCIKKNNIFICDKPNFLKTKLSHSCVGAMYEKNREAAMTHCQYEKRPFTESVIQIEPSTFIAFSPERFTTRFSCRTSSSTAEISSANRIFVAPDCSLHLQDHILLSSNHFTITGNTEIYDWDFNPLESPVGRLLDSSELLLGTTASPPPHEHHDDVTRAQYENLLLAIFASLLLGALWPCYMAMQLFMRKCLWYNANRNTTVQPTSGRPLPALPPRPLLQPPPLQYSNEQPPGYPSHHEKFATDSV